MDLDLLCSKRRTKWNPSKKKRKEKENEIETLATEANRFHWSTIAVVMECDIISYDRIGIDYHASIAKTIKSFFL